MKAGDWAKYYEMHQLDDHEEVGVGFGVTMRLVFIVKVCPVMARVRFLERTPVVLVRDREHDNFFLSWTMRMIRKTELTVIK